jgi:hypothetical protein
VSHGPFAASQYVAGDDVVVLAWWGPHPGGTRPARARLAGLDGLALPEKTASTFGSTLVHLVRHP